MHNADITNSNTLPHEVKIDLNVFGALMLNRVGGHVNCADIITVYQGGMTKRSMEFLKELAQPGSLGHTIRHCAILSLCTGP